MLSDLTLSATGMRKVCGKAEMGHNDHSCGSDSHRGFGNLVGDAVTLVCFELTDVNMTPCSAG